MQRSGNNFKSFIAALCLAAALSGCGDTSPDLEARPLYNDSELRLSLPVDELIIQWAAFTDAEGVVVADAIYTVKQDADPNVPELISGGEIQLTDTQLSIDISQLGPTVFDAFFEVSTIDPATGESVAIAFFQRFITASREMQFDWYLVEDATGYLLTQTNGRFEALPGGMVELTADDYYLRFEVPVHLFDWQNSLFLLEACMGGVVNGSACDGGEWQTVGYQDTAFASSAFIGNYSDPTPDTNSIQLAFAFSLALAESGNTLVAGEIGDSFLPVEQRVCPEDPDNAGQLLDCELEDQSSFALNAGAVQIFDLETNESTYLKSPNVSALDVFGSAVAISDDGQTLAVTALGESSDATGIATQVAADQNNDAAYSGAVYVYVNNAGSWELEAYIKASLSAEDYLFGLDLAMSGDGNTLAVSTTSDASDPQAAQGAVYIYTRTAGVWSESALLKGGVAGESALGHSVEMSGDGQYLAVSSLGPALSRTTSPVDVCTAEAGRVFLFAREQDNWVQTDVVKAPNGRAGDCFGRSLSFDHQGNLLLIGAPFEDRLTAGVVPVGSSLTGNARNVGAAYLFERSAAGVSSSWNSKSYYFKASNPNNQAVFGMGVALSSDGRFIAAGSPRDGSSSAGVNGNQSAENNSNSGAAYVFAADGGGDNWQQVAFVKAPAAFPNQFFGAPIEFAKAGNMLAIAGNGFAWDGQITRFPGFAFLY